MSMQDRIVYDSNELIQILEGSLDRLKAFRFDHRYRALLGDSLIHKIDVWDSNVRKQKDSPLTLVVCGEFKRGKSSFIKRLFHLVIKSMHIANTKELRHLYHSPIYLLVSPLYCINFVL